MAYFNKFNRHSRHDHVIESHKKVKAVGNRDITIDSVIENNLSRDLETINHIDILCPTDIKINENIYTLHRLSLRKKADGIFELEISAQYGVEHSYVTYFDEGGNQVAGHSHSLAIPIKKGKIMKLKVISEEDV